VRIGLKAGCAVAYFELKVGACAAAPGEADCIAVGLGSDAFPLHGRQPGWDSHSYGYHSDDGRLFHGSGTRSRASWPRFQPGDIVGCGISIATRQIFYTLNGGFLGIAFTAKASHLPLYPLVGLDSHAEVSFNFGQQTPFRFDLSTLPPELNQPPPRRKAPSPLRQLASAFRRERALSW